MPVLKLYKKDLKQAIVHRENGILNDKIYDCTQDCLVAIASKRLFKELFDWCASNQIQLYDSNRYLNDKVREIINLFDDHKYEEIKSMLPLHIELGEPLNNAQTKVQTTTGN
jgi:hypothetical protein